ncbi:hypothetical protein DV735_g4725, partial [Chaetothyriales sp. CBS 134920]
MAAVALNRPMSPVPRSGGQEKKFSWGYRFHAREKKQQAAVVVRRPALDLVLDHLRELHLSRTSTSCTTCYLRDLSALSQTCRAFSLPTQDRLYASIQIVGRDSVDQQRCLGIKHGTRLVLLRRTLRSNSTLAALVRRLHVPDPMISRSVPGRIDEPNPAYVEYVNILASLVMCCPNLESFTGFYAFYAHTFDRLAYALSTRPRLATHVWVIAENAEVSKRARDRPPPGLLSPAQHREFVSYHANWARLRTLLLCSPGSAGVLEEHVLLEILQSLPSLRHLGLSSFDADDVNDATLLALPSTLKALRLEQNRGITDAGLARWAASFVPSRLERLSLIHQALTSLVTISKILSGLYRLRRFTILQSDLVPALPPSNAVVSQPFLASFSLQFLHWDVAEPVAPSRKFARASSDFLRRANPGKLTVNEHLALSISHHGFPALRYLRAPRDVSPPGALQAVCRKVENANMLRPEDVFWMKTGQNPAASAASSNSLQAARVRAQRLINEEAAKAAAKNKPSSKDLRAIAARTQSYSRPSTPPRMVAIGGSTTTTRQASPVRLPRSTASSTPRSTSRSTSRAAPKNMAVSHMQARDDENLSTSSSWSSSNPGSSITRAATNSTITTNDSPRSEHATVVDSHRDVICQSCDEQRGRSEHYLPASKIPTRTHGLRSQASYCTADHMVNAVGASTEPGYDLSSLKRRAAIRSERNSRPGTANAEAAEAAAAGAVGGVEASAVAAAIEAAAAVAGSNYNMNSSQTALSGRLGRRPSLLPTDSSPAPAPKPLFWLYPDIPGRDANGGLVGWAELLRVSERQQAGQSLEPEQDGERTRARRATRINEDDNTTQAPSTKKTVRVVTPAATASTVSVAMSAKSSRSRPLPPPSTLLSEHPDDEWIKDGCDGGWNNTNRMFCSSSDDYAVATITTMPPWQHTFRERSRGQREGRDVALAAELVFF